jgi:hypothetical protein
MPCCACDDVFICGPLFVHCRVVNCVKEALHERLLEINWMSEDTRTEAIRKMNNFRVKIGFPVSDSLSLMPSVYKGLLLIMSQIIIIIFTSCAGRLD